MDPVTLGLIGAPILGGLLGAGLSSGDRRRAIEAQKAALQQFLDLKIPDPAEQQLVLQEYEQTGRLDPRLEEALTLGESEFENIRLDPRLKESRMRALGELENLGLSGGMTLTDRANIEQALNESLARGRGQQESIMQRAAQQGVSGSGLSLAAQRDAAQAAQAQASAQQLQTLGSARDRALQAIIGGGELAGQMQQFEYGMGADRAKAADAISAFNLRNRQDVNRRNVASQNAAQQYNLGLQQRLAEQNVGLRNQQQQHNKALLQQRYQNELAKAQGAAGAYGGMANAYLGEANRTANQFAGIGAGVGAGLGAYQQNQFQNQMLAESRRQNDLRQSQMALRDYDLMDENDLLRGQATRNGYGGYYS